MHIRWVFALTRICWIGLLLHIGIFVGLLCGGRIPIVDGFRINTCKKFHCGRDISMIPVCRINSRSFRIESFRRTGDRLQFDNPSPPASDFKINRNIIADSVRIMLPILGDVTADNEHQVVGMHIESIRKTAGVMDFEKALSLAKLLDLDLVLINENGLPPVCKIVDLGKYKYSLDKKKKEQERKRTQQGLKEIKLSCTINQHDLDCRIKAATDLMQSGNKIKFTVNFKGRELQHPEIGTELLNRISSRFGSNIVVEEATKQEGKTMYMIIRPKPTRPAL